MTLYKHACGFGAVLLVWRNVASTADNNSIENFSCMHLPWAGCRRASQHSVCFVVPCALHVCDPQQNLAACSS